MGFRPIAAPLLLLGLACGRTEPGDGPPRPRGGEAASGSAGAAQPAEPQRPERPELQHVGYRLEEWSAGAAFHVTFARVRVHNGTAHRFTYALGAPRFHRRARTDGGWQPVPRVICATTGHVRGLGPGESVVLEALLPSEGVVRLGLDLRPAAPGEAPRSSSSLGFATILDSGRGTPTTVWTDAIPPLDSHWSEDDGLPALIPPPPPWDRSLASGYPADDE